MVLKDANGKPKVFLHKSSLVKKGKLMDYETMHAFVTECLVKEYTDKKYAAVNAHNCGDGGCDFKITMPSGRVVCCKIVLTEESFQEVIAKTDFSLFLDHCKKEKAYPRLYTVSAWCFATPEGSKMIHGSTFAFKVDSISLLDADETPSEREQSEESLITAFSDAWNARDTTLMNSILHSHVHYSSSFVFDQIRGREETIAYMGDIFKRFIAVNGKSRLTLCRNRQSGELMLADMFKNGVFTFKYLDSKISEITLRPLDRKLIDCTGERENDGQTLSPIEGKTSIEDGTGQGTQIIEEIAEGSSNETKSCGHKPMDTVQNEDNKQPTNFPSYDDKLPEYLGEKVAETYPESERADIQQKKNSDIRPKKAIKWKKILSVAIPSLCVAALLTLFILVLAGDYPGDFNSFGDKFKFYFNIPNNRLAREYIEKYRSAEQAGLDEISKGFAETARSVNPSEQDILDTLTYIYSHLGASDAKYYLRAIAVSSRGLDKYPEDTFLMELNSLASFQMGIEDPEGHGDLWFLGFERKTSKQYLNAAYSMAERLLLLDPLNPVGHYMMCRKSLGQEDWKNLKRWSDKGLTLTESSLYSCFLYFKAKALYENQEYAKAKELYLSAERINSENPLHSEFIRVGGVPCKVISVKIENLAQGGRLITGGGHTLYDDNTRYLRPVLKIVPHRIGRFNFKVKLYYNGELQSGKNSPEGYTYGIDVNLSSLDTQYVELGGWGNDKPGTWKNGAYSVGIWWEGEELYVHSFDIYSAYYHQYGGGNRFDYP